MKKINNKGFSRKEYMLMLAVIAILMALGLKTVFDKTKSYGSLKTLANKFADAVAKYKDEIVYKYEYSLYELEIERFVDDFTNPFDKNERCDKHESFVEMPDVNEKKVTLVCGNYMIHGQQNEYYYVYELTEWSTEKKSGDNENAMLYNYKKNGELMLSKSVPERTFVFLYNEKNGENITSAKEVENKKDVELIAEVGYRNKKLVKEFKK